MGSSSGSCVGQAPGGGSASMCARKTTHSRQLELLSLAFLAALLIAGLGCSGTSSFGKLLITAVSPQTPEYVELYNPASESIPLDNLQIAYYSDGKTSWAAPHRVIRFPDGSVIKPHRFFLVTFDDSGCKGDWAAATAPMLRAEGGAVAILQGEPSETGVLDAVGWGTSQLALGSAASRVAQGLSLVRRPGEDYEDPFVRTRVNAVDFLLAPLAPRSEGAAAIILVRQSGIAGETGALPELTLWNVTDDTGVFQISISSDIGLRTTPRTASVALPPWGVGLVHLELSPYSFCVLDFETSGLSPAEASIIEVGWARFCQGELAQTSSSLVRLEGELDPFITWLTGITPAMLEDAPALGTVIPVVLNTIAGDPVASYSVNRFEERFLSAATSTLGLDNAGLEWIDAYAWANRGFPDIQSHALGAMAEGLGLGGQDHRALADAVLAGQVLIAAVRRVGCSFFVSVFQGDRALPLASIALSIPASWLVGEGP
jgi:DNA polymerase-3 subunit epsilon